MSTDFSIDPSAMCLVISDIAMPNGRGSKMVDAMAKIKPGVKVIVHDDVCQIQHSCAVFIKKPFTMDEISPFSENQVDV